VEIIKNIATVQMQQGQHFFSSKVVYTNMLACKQLEMAIDITSLT